MSPPASEEARAYFEAVWRADEVGWAGLGESGWQAVYERQLALLGGRSYRRALELGCGAGQFTAALAGLTDRLVAVDVAPTAVEHARRRLAGDTRVELVVADVMDHDLTAGAPWDLVVMNDTIYYVGSLYTFVEVAWLAAAIFDATAPGGRFLLANASSPDEGANEDMRPWVIRTYRDLFLNVGYELEAEEAFGVSHGGADFEVLLSLFRRRS